MSEMNIESLESALGAAFGDPAPEIPKAAPKAEEAPESDPADLLEGHEEVPLEEAPKEEAEPEFEIEIEPGKPEVLPLAKLKELAARGAKAGRGFEENARVREALQAQHQRLQLQAQFNQAASQDIAYIQALEQQLQPYEQMDWSAEYDRDPFNAMKVKEQRDQLRERRAAAIQNFNVKQQQFQGYVQQTQQQALAAEQEALLAKVPVWRNPEKATQERSEITGALTSHYGFTPGEVGQIMDHRMILVARDAAAYRRLLANKDAKVKQAREAPATARPGASEAVPNGRVELNKITGKIKELGSKGNHRAQEELATRLFGAAFK